MIYFFRLWYRRLESCLYSLSSQRQNRGFNASFQSPFTILRWKIISIFYSRFILEEQVGGGCCCCCEDRGSNRKNQNLIRPLPCCSAWLKDFKNSLLLSVPYKGVCDCTKNPDYAFVLRWSQCSSGKISLLQDCSDFLLKTQNWSQTLIRRSEYNWLFSHCPTSPFFSNNKIATKERDCNDTNDGQDRGASGNTQHHNIHKDKIQQSQGKAEVLLTMNRRSTKSHLLEVKHKHFSAWKIIKKIQLEERMEELPQQAQDRRIFGYFQCYVRSLGRREEWEGVKVAGTG